MTIAVLPDHVANKIAAGEVVERPASVVRELVDNSVDAGATDIAVHLVEGGHVSIRVIDNGSGMTPEEAPRALLRHATSKITSAEDLWEIRTLGFRGEALPSIAAVAKLCIRTRRADAELGVELKIEGGTIVESGPASCPVGTSVEVRSLFYNTPARRKFLRSPRSEEQRIKLWLTSMALVRPKVRFVLVADGDEVLNLPPRSTERERAQSVLRGAGVVVDAPGAEVGVHGLVGHPTHALPDARGLYLFVNGRLIADRALARAAKDGFGALLKDRQYPTGFLHLTLPGGTVDVNVHPQKSEVRFAHPERVFQSIRHAVRRSLEQLEGPIESRPSPMASSAAAFTAAVGASRGGPGLETAAPLLAPRAFSFMGASDSDESPPAGSAAPNPPAGFRFSSLRYIGQALACYLVCEFERTLVIVDMHAAHERWNYNRILAILRSRNVEAQPLLIPFELTLAPDQVEQILQHRPLLERLGFEFRDGSETLIVTSVPSMLAGRDLGAFFLELSTFECSDEVQVSYTRIEEEVASRLACHASIRSGRDLEREEVYSLFELLDSTECSAACPHGRPVVIAMNEREIERRFGRVS